jgi:hypothetical protein
MAHGTDIRKANAFIGIKTNSLGISCNIIKHMFVNDVHWSKTPSIYYTNKVLDHIRKCYYSSKKPNINSVDIAIHVRRGDVGGGKHMDRYVPDDVYKKIIGKFIDMYTHYAQEFISISSYWRDPFNYGKYLDVSLLADLNNEYYSKNSTINYHRFSKLNNFVMVYSINDEIVTPPESGKFSTYDMIQGNDHDNSLDIIPLNYTIMYKTLGLDIFDKENRLFIYQTNCLHEEHKNENCFSQLYNMFKKFCL